MARVVLCSLLLGAAPAVAEPMNQEPVLKVAVAPGYYPMLYAGPKGSLQGFDVEYAKALAGRLQRRLEFVVVAYDQLIPTVMSSRADIGMGALDLHADTKGVPYVEYFQIPDALMVKAESPLKAALEPDLRKVRIGTLTVARARETFQEKAAKRLVTKAYGYEGEPALLDALARGMIDGAVLHLPTAIVRVATSKGAYRLAAASIAREPLGIAVDPKQPHLYKSIEAAARSLQANGTVGRLESKIFALTYERAANGTGG